MPNIAAANLSAVGEVVIVIGIVVGSVPVKRIVGDDQINTFKCFAPARIRWTHFARSNFLQQGRMQKPSMPLRENDTDEQLNACEPQSVKRLTNRSTACKQVKNDPNYYGQARRESSIITRASDGFAASSGAVDGSVRPFSLLAREIGGPTIPVVTGLSYRQS